MLQGILKAIQKQEAKQRGEERRLLEDIAALADYETAKAAAELYAAEKHAYSFDGYLYQLSKLKAVLNAGIPPDVALEAVDSCLDAETIIKQYKGE